MTDLVPVLVTPPAKRLISREDARQHLRVDAADDDVLVDGLVDAVTAYMDGRSGVLGRCLQRQTWKSFSAAIEDTRLPFPDAVTTGATVQYYDVANVLQTFNASWFAILADSMGSYLRIDPAAAIPAVYDRPDAVAITVTYGFDPVPSSLVTAAKILLSHFYETRDGSADLPAAFKALIAPYRHVGL